MDSRKGRFVSSDVWVGAQHNPITLNKYIYASSNPLVYVDPTGLSPAHEQSTAMNVQLQLMRIQIVATGLGGVSAQTMAQVIGVRLAISTLIAATAGGAAIAVSEAHKSEIRECMRASKKGERHGCRVELDTFIIGDGNNEVRDHVADAISTGRPRKLSRKQPEHDRYWLEAFKKPGMVCNGSSQQRQCDEYPWAASIEGGEGSGASLRLVDGKQNGSVGSHLGWFHKHCKIPPNVDSYKYIVLPIKGIEQTGYICR